LEVTETVAQDRVSEGTPNDLKDSVDTEGLFAILSDKTRRTILIVLEQRKTLSYAELAKSLGITHTGKLNYHLKSLGDLITKDPDGKYTLSGKGELAIQVLNRFRGASNSASKFRTASRWATLGAALFVVQPSIILIALAANGVLGTGAFTLGPIEIGGPIGLALGILALYLPALLLVFLTKTKIIDPLRRFRLDKGMRKWTISFSLLSLFFGALVGLFVMERVDGRIKYMLEDSSISSNLSS
jgi:DNA-binding transcriptional ArsR family regulator